MSERVMFQLTESDQRLLLKIAREAVRAHLANELFTMLPIPPGPLHDWFGIFVSIHKYGELRGCIGNVHAQAPLHRSAADCAVSAAVGDPRFFPLAKDELPIVDFEISVLSPPRRIENISEIEIGKHGLLITKKDSRGLLLPQVANAYSWDSIRFLQETCRKAGLKADDWKEGATVELFSAFVFGEKHLHAVPAS